MRFTEPQNIDEPNMKNITEAIDSIFAELTPVSPKRQAIVIRVELDNALMESEKKISAIIPSKNGSSQFLGYVTKQDNGAVRNP
jgi:hypothetical protein